MKKLASLLLLIFGLSLVGVEAKPPKQKTEKLTPEQQKALDEYSALDKIEKELKFQDGKITVGDNLATLNLSDKYHFLDGKLAEKVLTELWGNPPSTGIDLPLGMIVPKEKGLLEPDSWAVVITYSDDGHVEDSDAESIDYNELLKTMQEATKENSAERVKQGFPAMDFVGWAEQPRYDKATHKLYWAKNLKIADTDDNTLNYDVRILGRSGFLSMNAVAPMSGIESVKQSMTEILPMADLNEGKRYADFDSSKDKVAEYGIAALIAGGIAAKTGILKIVGIALLKFIKPIIVGVIALGGIASKFLFGRKS